MSEGPQPGDAFAGHVIEAEVGRGGMGIVYRARNVALDRTRAIKVIAPNLSADPAFAARFRREARLAASVEHPNIVTVHHAGEEDGLLYIVMRYVDGVDLDRVIADGPLPPARALEILRPAAAALDAAHAGGLIHRDVKPANVLIEESAGGAGADRVYLTDFGISKPLSGEGASSATATTALTGGGQVLGTADYVSPEAVEGGAVDARSDVYSFACLAYHVLAGIPPFRRSNELATLIAHTKAERPSANAINHRLPPGVDGVLREGMAIDPAQRPASAGALVERLGDELAEGRVPGRSLPQRRRGTPAMLVAAVVLVALAAVGLVLLLDGSEDGAEVVGDGEVPDVPTVDTKLVGAGAVGVAVGDLRIWVAAREAELGGGEDPGAVYRLQRNAPIQAKPPLPLPAPRSVAVGFGSIWVVNGDQLYKLDPDKGRERVAIAVGAGPGDVAVDSRYVWVVNEDDDTVSRVDPFETGDVRSVAVGAEPRAIATGPGAVWVVSAGAATASRINPTDLRVTAEVSVGTAPTSIAVGTKSVWVVDNGEGNLYEIGRTDLKSGPPISVARKPRGVALGLGSVWVASGAEGVVERFDPADGTRVGEPIDVGPDPADIAVGDAAVYTANFGDGSVSRIEP